jgi:hypothetical protein
MGIFKRKRKRGWSITLIKEAIYLNLQAGFHPFPAMPLPMVSTYSRITDGLNIVLFGLKRVYVKLISDINLKKNTRNV